MHSTVCQPKLSDLENLPREYIRGRVVLGVRPHYYVLRSTHLHRSRFLGGPFAVIRIS